MTKKNQNSNKHFDGGVGAVAPIFKGMHNPITKLGVVSGLPGALYSICCLGVSTTLESEKIVTMWPTND